MNNTQRGREGMRNWLTSKPDNFFISDRNLQNVLRRYMGDVEFEVVESKLADFGGKCATMLDEAAVIEDRIGNHPRLERWSNIGDRVERIEFHPNHDLAGRIVWESGIISVLAKPGNILQQMALFYLLNHNGENGHACSVACTVGAVRALQAYANEDLKARYLTPILDSDYDRKFHASQFLTEIQGGSDVGLNAVAAVDNGDGTWRISGEKWFCSNINADVFLMTARVQGAPEGTRGLGMFLVPRLLDDGTTNGFFIRRLKDKLGTRTLASAEVDFVDAVAYPVGPLDQGFKIIVEFVLNTSRLLNAVACAGMMHRAYLEAGKYACSREAFGSVIANYPLVQEAIADIYSETYAAVASSFAVTYLLHKIETGQAKEDDKAVYRLFVNINKYATSIRGSEIIHRAMEVLGGNGAIESFSVLPRLYRDMMVMENWEGTHNTLAIQVLRDMGRYNLHLPFLKYVRSQLDTVSALQLQSDREIVQKALENVTSLLEHIQNAEDPRFGQAHMRRAVDALVYVSQAALLLSEAQWELDKDLPTDKPDVATYFINRHLRPNYDPMNDADYLDRLERLMASV